MANSKQYRTIPTKMTEAEFNEFILPHLTRGSRGPNTKLSFYRIFSYILTLIHTGCQWEELPIEKDKEGNPEIHFTRLFRIFKRWVNDGCFEKIFVGSVDKLFKNGLLDLKIIHGDGSTTAAKKGAITLGTTVIKV